MKNRNIFILGIALIAVITLSIVFTLIGHNNPDGPMTLSDGLERQVSLDGPAQKIVSLAPSNTEILYAVGAGSQVIARDNFSDYPAEASQLPGVGDAFGFNFEQIASLQPDLVLAAEINSPEQVKGLEELNINVFYLKNPQDLNGLYANLEVVGKLTGHQDESAELVKSLKARVKAVEDAAKTVTTKPLVFYELDGTDPAKPWTSGPGTFLELLLNMAGGENAGKNLTSEWAQISQEELIITNPEVILLGDAAYGMTAEAVAARPGWDSIRAVVNRKIFPFSDSLVSRPGPRMIEGLEELFKLIHPEAADFLKK